jgi:tellurite resistance protein
VTTGKSSSTEESTRQNLYNTALVDLCFLLSLADGAVTSKEEEACLAMAKHECIPDKLYSHRSKHLTYSDKNIVLAKALTAIKKLNLKSQINIIAWVALIANSDGFMAQDEWRFLYNIYHNELNLDLKQILERQKALNAILLNRYSISADAKIK